MIKSLLSRGLHWNNVNKVKRRDERMKYDSANLPEVSAARNCTRCATLCGGYIYTERKRWCCQNGANIASKHWKKHVIGSFGIKTFLSHSRSTCEWALLWLKRSRHLSSIYGWVFTTVETLQQRFSAVIDQVYFEAFGSVFSLLHLRLRAAVICSEKRKKKTVWS